MALGAPIIQFAKNPYLLCQRGNQPLDLPKRGNSSTALRLPIGNETAQCYDLTTLNCNRRLDHPLLDGRRINVRCICPDRRTNLLRDVKANEPARIYVGRHFENDAGIDVLH